MVTGDNMLTSLSVARDCGMIDYHDQVVSISASEEEDSGLPVVSWHYVDTPHKELDNSIPKQGSISIIVEKMEKFHVVLTGKTFAVLREHYPDLLKKVAVRGTVFSRMAPNQKQQLVEILQELGYYVGMCGDGANDCGALKAAHAGISLSEAEASVASPFTSKAPNISCVLTLIREGRAALVTSFGVFKYMAINSLIQFISVLILYTLYSNLTDMEYLYIDLFLITVFAALFGRTEAYPSLVKKPPPSSLVGITPLSSLFLQIIIITAAQVAAVLVLWEQPWYQPNDEFDDDNSKCHDNFAVFSVSAFQYITLAIVFSKGAPYRKSIFTNFLFQASLIIMTCCTLYLVLYPDPWLADLFEMELSGTTWEFRLIIAGIAVVHFIISYITEAFLVGYIIFHKCRNKLSCRQKALAQFHHIEEETCGAPTWLPLSESPTETSLTTLPHSNTLNSAFSGSSLEEQQGGGGDVMPMEEACHLKTDKDQNLSEEQKPNSYCKTQGTDLYTQTSPIKECDVLAQDVTTDGTSL